MYFTAVITLKFCCYPPQGEGNVFTSVCLFGGGGIVCLVQVHSWSLVPCPSQVVGYFWSHVLPRGVEYFWSHVLPRGLDISSHVLSRGRVSLGVVSREYGTPYTTHPAQRRPLPRLVCILLECFLVLITTRRQSLRRLCFYRCLSVHRGLPSPLARNPPPPSACWDTQHPPPFPRGYYGIRSTSGWYSSHSCYLNS